MSATGLEQLLTQKLYLQPHLHLFRFKRHLFQFRDTFLLEGDGDHWLTRDFPSLPGERIYHFVLYRSVLTRVLWKEIPATAYRLLSQFKAGSSVNGAIDWLEEQGLLDEAAEHLRSWLQEWIALGWLATRRR